MNISYLHVDGPNGKKMLVPEYDIENGNTLTTFMMMDARLGESLLMELLDKVLSGESDSETLSGNVCTLEITPSVSSIYDDLADDEESESTCCRVPTNELRDAIAEWCHIVQEYIENGN